MLSGGEKQRVGMARLFYHCPAFAVLDEATAAVSIDVEAAIYTHARSALSITLFSVSHRPSLLKFHEWHLQFDGNGNCSFGPLQADTSLDITGGSGGGGGGGGSKRDAPSQHTSTPASPGKGGEAGATDLEFAHQSIPRAHSSTTTTEDLIFTTPSANGNSSTDDDRDLSGEELTVTAARLQQHRGVPPGSLH